MELDLEASHYALRVHRVQEGDEIELFDYVTGEVARAQVGAVPRAKTARLPVVIAELRQDVDRALPLTLLCCLGKGDKPEQALRDATSLGASRVVLALSERVQNPGAERDRERYERVLIETARQSGRGKIPELVGPLAWSFALDEARGLRLACVPKEASVPLLRALTSWPPHEEITLLVGPEGGLSEAELAELGVRAFRFCSLGPFVLRAEKAVTVALGIARAYADVALPVD